MTDSKRVAIVYKTSEGHTFEVAGRIGDHLREAGLIVETFVATEPPKSLDAYAGIIVAGSVHAGNHDGALVSFVQQNLDAIDRVPNALVSVSLTAAKTDETHHNQAMKVVDNFVEKTGWHPDIVSLTGGMLAYTKYGFIKKQLMKHIAKGEGGETDTSRDWDLTDWAAVNAFAADFAGHVQGTGNLQGSGASVDTAA